MTWKNFTYKEGEKMEELSEEIMAHLAPTPVFEFSLFGITIQITNSVVNTWIIMAVVLVACIFLTRNLKIVPTGPQIVLETIVDWMNNFFGSTLGGHGKEYHPYLASVLIYVVLSNTVGFFGLTPPTKDLNVTASLAIMSILLIQISGIRQRGVKGWLHSFLEPMPIILPINIMELAIKPMSLCMRLFGNVLGAFIIMELIKAVAGFLVPVPLSCYFDLFDGVIQAYIFVFLTSLFMQEAMEE